MKRYKNLSLFVTYCQKSVLLFLTLPLAGCSTFVAKVQTADEAYLASKGVPIEVVQSIRKAVGMPDVRTLPGPERVLPEGLMLYYDVLDADNKVVDVSGFHRAEMPRIVPAGTAQPSIFDARKDPIAGISDLLKKIDLSNGTPLPVP